MEVFKEEIKREGKTVKGEIKRLEKEVDSMSRDNNSKSGK